jgi:hypothetical protein
MTKIITIQNTSEETDCNYCGMPLYTGDEAVLWDDKVFCSPTCRSDYAQSGQATLWTALLLAIVIGGMLLVAAQMGHPIDANAIKQAFSK